MQLGINKTKGKSQNTHAINFNSCATNTITWELPVLLYDKMCACMLAELFSWNCCSRNLFFVDCNNGLYLRQELVIWCFYTMTIIRVKIMVKIVVVNFHYAITPFRLYAVFFFARFMMWRWFHYNVVLHLLQTAPNRQVKIRIKTRKIATHTHTHIARKKGRVASFKTDVTYSHVHCTPFFWCRSRKNEKHSMYSSV